MQCQKEKRNGSQCGARARRFNGMCFWQVGLAHFGRTPTFLANARSARGVLAEGTVGTVGHQKAIEAVYELFRRTGWGDSGNGLDRALNSMLLYHPGRKSKH